MKERPDLTRGGLNFPLFFLSPKFVRHNLTGKYVPKGKKNWFPAKKEAKFLFGFFKTLSFLRVIMGSGCEKRGQKLGVSWVARHKSKTPSVRPLLRQHDAPPSLLQPDVQMDSRHAVCFFSLFSSLIAARKKRFYGLRRRPQSVFPPSLKARILI